MRTFFGAAAALAAVVYCGADAPRAQTQQPPPPQPSATAALGIKYMRDSEEYAALTRQVYRLAADAVARRAQGLSAGSWAVVLDVDETSLDNSTYQLERASYGGPSFENTSWNAWVRRQQAATVPGVVDFIAAVRRAGGRIAWITNRDGIVADATRANLRGVGLWSDEDRLCAQDTAERTKAVRRGEVVSGRGSCSWNAPVRIVVFVGDQMGDFPAADERIPDTGTDEAFGRACFLLPNSMYGGWTTRVTRR